MHQPVKVGNGWTESSWINFTDLSQDKKRDRMAAESKYSAILKVMGGQVAHWEECIPLRPRFLLPCAADHHLSLYQMKLKKLLSVESIQTEISLITFILILSNKNLL